MNNIKDKKYSETLKELSKTDNGNYATESLIYGVDFDLYTKDSFPKAQFASVDAIVFSGSKLFLIEFKYKDMLVFKNPNDIKRFEGCRMCEKCSESDTCSELKREYKTINKDVKGIVNKVKDTLYFLNTSDDLQEVMQEYTYENIEFILCTVTEEKNIQQRRRSVVHTLQGQIHKIYVPRKNIHVAYNKEILEEIINK